MANAAAMLQTHPNPMDGDASRLGTAIERLLECASTCTQCADACLSEGNPDLAKCIRLNLDCADICNAMSRVVSRQTEYDAEVTRPLLEACMAACRSCGEECERHADHMEHCRICAEQCRAGEQSCRTLLAAMA